MFMVLPTLYNLKCGYFQAWMYGGLARPPF